MYLFLLASGLLPELRIVFLSLYYYYYYICLTAFFLGQPG